MAGVTVMGLRIGSCDRCLDATSQAALVVGMVEAEVFVEIAYTGLGHRSAEDGGDPLRPRNRPIGDVDTPVAERGCCLRDPLGIPGVHEGGVLDFTRALGLGQAQVSNHDPCEIAKLTHLCIRERSRGRVLDAQGTDPDAGRQD